MVMVGLDAVFAGGGGVLRLLICTTNATTVNLCAHHLDRESQDHDRGVGFTFLQHCVIAPAFG